jgi:hypothetical protein
VRKCHGNGIIAHGDVLPFISQKVFGSSRDLLFAANNRQVFMTPSQVVDRSRLSGAPFDGDVADFNAMQSASRVISRAPAKSATTVHASICSFWRRAVQGVPQIPNTSTGAAFGP